MYIAAADDVDWIDRLKTFVTFCRVCALHCASFSDFVVVEPDSKLWCVVVCPA